MATADSVKSKLQGLIDSANGVTGGNNTTLTAAVNALIAGFGSGGGSARGIYMAKVTPSEDLTNMAIAHNLGTIDILLVAFWAETLGDIVPVTTSSLAKFWAKTDIATQRGGGGFSPGYAWNITNGNASPSSPNTANYEKLTVIDENNISLPMCSSGKNNSYLAGVTYTVIVIAANATEVSA